MHAATRGTKAIFHSSLLSSRRQHDFADANTLWLFIGVANGVGNILGSSPPKFAQLWPHTHRRWHPGRCGSMSGVGSDPQHCHFSPIDQVRTPTPRRTAQWLKVGVSALLPSAILKTARKLMRASGRDKAPGFAQATQRRCAPDAKGSACARQRLTPAMVPDANPAGLRLARH